MYIILLRTTHAQFHRKVVSYLLVVYSSMEVNTLLTFLVMKEETEEILVEEVQMNHYLLRENFLNSF
jgi:hypothetical protein